MSRPILVMTHPGTLAEERADPSSNRAAVQRWLGLEVRSDGLDLIDDSPRLIACQRASFFDALLPTVTLAQRSDAPARHVLKRELAWDPCLSLFGNRHANHFVTREGGERHDESRQSRISPLRPEMKHW